MKAWEKCCTRYFSLHSTVLAIFIGCQQHLTVESWVLLFSTSLAQQGSFERFLRLTDSNYQAARLFAFSIISYVSHKKGICKSLPICAHIAFRLPKCKIMFLSGKNGFHFWLLKVFISWLLYPFWAHREGAVAYPTCIWVKAEYTPKWVTSSSRALCEHLGVRNLTQTSTALW